MPRSWVAAVAAIFLALGGAAPIAVPALAQTPPSAPPTLVLELPFVPRSTDVASALFRFELQYATVAVVGGLIGHSLMDALGYGFPGDVWGAIGGATLAGLIYVLRNGTLHEATGPAL